jgi:acyl carrier protein
MAGEVCGLHHSITGGHLFAQREKCLPLVPTSKPKHAVESYEATNRSVVHENPKASNKRVSAPGPARSKKIDVSSVVQKTVEELLGTVVPSDAPLMGAGLDSLSAVDLVQTLGQRLGTELEPTALFDYPTIGSLSKYLDEQMEPEVELSQESNIVPINSQLEAEGKAVQECFVAATAMYLPTVERSFAAGDLEGLSRGRFETATHVPVTRWNMDSIDTCRFSADARSRVRYGSFLQSDFAMFDNTMFRISPAEARPLEPQQRMLLEVGYEALHRQGQNRSTLVDSDTGIFTGMMQMDA